MEKLRVCVYTWPVFQEIIRAWATGYSLRAETHEKHNSADRGGFSSERHHRAGGNHRTLQLGYGLHGVFMPLRRLNSGTALLTERHTNEN